MEIINKEFGKLTSFNFKTTNYKGIKYLVLEPFLINDEIILNKPIYTFESKIEPLINYFINYLDTFYKDVKEIYTKDDKYFWDENNNKINTICKHIKHIKRLASQLKIELNFPQLDEYKLSFYLITDLLFEIEQRIEFLNNLKIKAKPYLQDNKEGYTHIICFDIFDTNNSLRNIEDISISEWCSISLNRGIPQESFFSNPSNQDNILFDDIIIPEAREEFEKWYERFCIDEPNTNYIDIVLFFKIMKKKGYFKNKLNSGKKLNLDILYQVTLDKTKLDIAYNTFKNNGTAQFENYLFGKPEIPIFRN